MAWRRSGPPQRRRAPATPPTEPAAPAGAAWAGSDRAARLPADWDQRKAEADRRNPRRICHVCGQPGGDELDHKQRGDDHRQENLDWIHGWRYVQAMAAQGISVRNCHGEKSSAEGNAARPRLNRPAEEHPALR